MDRTNPKSLNPKSQSPQSQSPKSLNLLLCALFVASCADSKTDAGLTPVYDKETGKLQRLDFDSDKDGRIDTVSFMDGQKVVRIEIDKDQDGRVERWEYYGAERTLERVGFSRSNDGKEDAWSYQGPDGAVARIDVSVNRDGRVNRREFYEKQRLARAEEVDGPGLEPGAALAEAQTWKPARWETYDSSGRLTMVAFDSSGRGTADRRLVYDEAGTARLELDPDGDGRFELSR